MCITSFRIRICHPVLPDVFHFLCPFGGCGFCLPGLSHSGIKEYGQMLNPEVQDQIGMCLILILSAHWTTNSFSVMQFSILVEHISTSLC